MATMVDKAIQTDISWEKIWKRYKEESKAESKIRRRAESASSMFRQSAMSATMKAKEKLIPLLQRRQSKDDVVNKGFLKERLVFGANLEELAGRDATTDGVPVFARRCIEAMEEKERISEEGIYRVNGNAAEIQKLRFVVDENARYDLKDRKWDVHTLTGALKLFFRELAKPLIPGSFYVNVKPLLKAENPVARIRKEVMQMSGPHLKTLTVLVKHLVKVISADNRMTEESIALVFGPNLMWRENPAIGQNMAEDIMLPTQVLRFFLTNSDIFEHASSENCQKQLTK